MTTDSISAGDDAHRLLSDVRDLAGRVCRDQRLTWVALLVLARLERNVALLLFTAGYLALVLLVLPTTGGMGLPGWLPSFLSGANTQLRLSMTLPQLITGAALLAGGIGFAKARRRQG